jgi:hypothetical protein
LPADTLTRFTSTGLDGIWYPACSLSGTLQDCEVILDAYYNVMHEGLPSPGGTPRYYYDSMWGFGTYYPESDSIVLFINYIRSSAWAVEFHDYVHLVKN